MLKRLLWIAGTLVLTASMVPVAAARQTRVDNSRFTERIRKELVKLPYYGVFDNLAFEINGNDVILYGQVVRPSTRKDAERRVARIEGVDHVINRIQVLSPSSSDDAIRRRVYNAVFRSDSLYRYALGANPSIHIVVNHGHVILEGVVSSQMDSQLAYMAESSAGSVLGYQ